MNLDGMGEQAVSPRRWKHPIEDEQVKRAWARSHGGSPPLHRVQGTQANLHPGPSDLRRTRRHDISDWKKSRKPLAPLDTQARFLEQQA